MTDDATKVSSFYTVIPFELKTFNLPITKHKIRIYYLVLSAYARLSLVKLFNCSTNSLEEQFQGV